MVTGVAGTFADSERNKGAEAVFKANPGIKVVAKYSGNWDSAAAQRATAAQLPSLPKVDGVWVSGGTDGVLKAFMNAGKPLPVTAGEAENGFRRFLLPQGYKGKTRPGDVDRPAAVPVARVASNSPARSSPSSAQRGTSCFRSRSSPTRPSSRV